MSGYNKVTNYVDGDIEMSGGDSDNVKSLTIEHGSDMQRVILGYFGILGFVSLAVLYGSLIGIVVGTNGALTTDIEMNLNSQMKDQAFSTISEAGDYLTRILNSYDQNICNYTSLATQRSLNSNMFDPSGPRPENYWDLENGDNGLKLPLKTDDPRFEGQTVSLGASAFYVMNSTETEVRALPKNDLLWDVVNSTTSLDPYMKHVWDNTADLIQMYIGFGTNPPSMRRYPGRAAHSPTGEAVGSGDDYNPVERGWYEDANNARPRTIFTLPYWDAHDLGWMITGAKAVYPQDQEYDPSSSDAILGVVGADILIKDIADVLNSIKFLETGKLTLFSGQDGIVVSDQEWKYSLDNAQNRPEKDYNFKYSELTSPSVSDDTWEKIRDTPPGQTQEITVSKGDDESANELIFVKRLVDYDAQYYLVVFVNEAEILEPVKPALDEMKKSNTVVSGALVGALFASMIVLMAFMYLLIKNIIKVFNKMQENVEALLRNVGTGRGLGDGMVEVNEYASNELQHLENSMNAMVHNLQKQRSSQFIEVEGGANATQKDKLEELWGMVPMGQAIDASAPPLAASFIADDDAPPAY